MRHELKYWRDLSKEEKSRLKSEHNIQTVTYEFIQNIYKSVVDKSEDNLLSHE